MINEQNQNDDGIVINLGNKNEFEVDSPTNEFEEEDENDFLDDSSNKDSSSYVLKDDVSEDTKIPQEETSNVQISGNNDAVINAENEKMLFEKLGNNNYFDIFNIFYFILYKNIFIIH